MVLRQSKSQAPGWPAPGFTLPGTDDIKYSLADFSNKKGVLIAFTCNHCPYAQAAWPLIIELHKKFQASVNFVAINPNDEQAYPEDSLAAMKQRVTEWGITMPYLRDESQAVARAYQAQCTPDIYLFKNNDGQFELFYHGRINDNWQRPDQVKEKNLEQALEQLTANQAAPAQQPPSMGCSIKWKKQDANQSR